MKKVILLRTFALFTAFCTAAVPVFATSSVEDLAGAERAVVLRSTGGPVTEVQTRNPIPRLLPRHSGLQEFVTKNMDSLGPNILVETLFLYRKPSGAGGWSEAEQTSLFNRITALSALAGIEYFSESRQAMRVFYDISHVVDNPASRNPLPDPTFAVIPESVSLYVRQRDLTFGDNIYRFDFRTSGDSIFFLQENLTSMTRGIIPAIGRNRLRTIFALIDTEDSILLYAVAMARTAPVPGMNDRIGSSFNNRARAIIQWFANQADKVFY